MISQLRGKILTKQPPKLVLDVHGVGYEVQMPMSSFYQLAESSQEVTVLTHFVVREDAQLLFGFITALERTVFQELIKVNGVGPKLALAILSGMSVEEFMLCVEAGDTASLVRLPGVGKKTAERLLIEMRDRLKTLENTQYSQTLISNKTSQQGGAENDPLNDAISALIALGYKPNDATKRVMLHKDKNLNSQELIRVALSS